MEQVRIQRDAVIWEGASEDGKVTGYLLKNYRGGATGDVIVDLAVADTGSNQGLLILLCDTKGTPDVLHPEWTGNVLYVRYSTASIWNFSNAYPYGNGNTAKSYEVVLSKQVP